VAVLKVGSETRQIGRAIRMGSTSTLIVAALISPPTLASTTPPVWVSASIGEQRGVCGQQANWPKFHLDLGNTGYNACETEIGIDDVSSLAVAWQARVGRVHGTPALWNGRIFVAGGTTQFPVATIVTAMNGRSGSIIWRRSFPYSDGTLSGLAYKAGALYLGTNDYVFHSLDASTGAERWKVFLGGIPGNAVAAGNRVYVAKGSGVVYALDAKTGREIWESANLGGPLGGTPALAGGLLYVGGYDLRLHALDAATGSEVWSYRTGGTIEFASPTVAGSLVYVASDDMYLQALGAASGTLVWRQSLGQQMFLHPPSPAVAQGVVYASGNGAVRAFNAIDGTPLWSTQIADASGSPVVANGVLYVAGGLEGSFHALDAATGAPLWSFTAGKAIADPIVADGMVYAGSLDTNLYAFTLPT
jgi:outer membrane protein assembly factor BamB